MHKLRWDQVARYFTWLSVPTMCNYSTSVETQARIWLHKKSTVNCVPFHSQHGQQEWSQGPETQRVRCFYLTLERYSFHEEEAKSAIFFDLMTGIKGSLLWSNKLGTTIKRYCSQITPYHSFTIIPKTINRDSPVSQVLPSHHSSQEQKGKTQNEMFITWNQQDYTCTWYTTASENACADTAPLK